MAPGSARCIPAVPAVAAPSEGSLRTGLMLGDENVRYPRFACRLTGLWRPVCSQEDAANSHGSMRRKSFAMGFMGYMEACMARQAWDSCSMPCGSASSRETPSRTWRGRRMLLQSSLIH